MPSWNMQKRHSALQNRLAACKERGRPDILEYFDKGFLNFKTSSAESTARRILYPFHFVLRSATGFLQRSVALLRAFFGLDLRADSPDDPLFLFRASPPPLLCLSLCGRWQAVRRFCRRLFRFVPLAMMRLFRMPWWRVL